MEAFEYNGWELIVDFEQVSPDDPGAGMPVTVRAPNGDWGSYNYALEHGMCWDTEVPANVLKWLNRMENTVNNLYFD
jgi:hypothetical protein